MNLKEKKEHFCAPPPPPPSEHQGNGQWRHVKFHLVSVWTVCVNTCRLDAALSGDGGREEDTMEGEERERWNETRLREEERKPGEDGVGGGGANRDHRLRGSCSLLSSHLHSSPLLSSLPLLSLGEHCSSIQQLAEPCAFFFFCNSSRKKENHWRAAALICGALCAMHQHPRPSSNHLR